MRRVKLLRLIITVALIAATPAALASELVVIVSKANPTGPLSKTQLIDLFMGKYVAFPNGEKAVPLDIEGNSVLREEFYRELVGMPLARVNAYWSRVKFSGKARPPFEQKDEQAILHFLAATENAIGYVNQASVTPAVKVVYRFDE